MSTAPFLPPSCIRLLVSALHGEGEPSMSPSHSPGSGGKCGSTECAGSHERLSLWASVGRWCPHCMQAASPHLLGTLGGLSRLPSIATVFSKAHILHWIFEGIRFHGL